MGGGSGGGGGLGEGGFRWVWFVGPGVGDAVGDEREYDLPVAVGSGCAAGVEGSGEVGVDGEEAGKAKSVDHGGHG